MHLWPRGRRNLVPFQDVPPVPRTGHPHRLEPNPHHRTARRMATQQLGTILKQMEVLGAVRRGLVPTAVYTLLRTHAEDPQATAAHKPRTAVAKTAKQLTYRTHKYLQHAANLPQTDQAHLLKLLFYQPREPAPRHTTQHGTPHHAYTETRPSGQEQRSQWHGQQHCLAQKT